jgi:hypothetical protein
MTPGGTGVLQNLWGEAVRFRPEYFLAAGMSCLQKWHFVSARAFESLIHAQQLFLPSWLFMPFPAVFRLFA